MILVEAALSCQTLSKRSLHEMWQCESLRPTPLERLGAPDWPFSVRVPWMYPTGLWQCILCMWTDRSDLLDLGRLVMLVWRQGCRVSVPWPSSSSSLLGVVQSKGAMSLVPICRIQWCLTTTEGRIGQKMGKDEYYVGSTWWGCSLEDFMYRVLFFGQVLTWDIKWWRALHTPQLFHYLV